MCASATCSSAARRGSPSPSTCRPSSATTPTTRVAAGEVGRTGVAIDSIADMELLFDAIPLGEVSTSMTINAPASLLLLLYELVAEEQGVAGERLRGTVQNDILKEYVARGNYIFPPRPSMRLTTDLFAYCEERLPSWNTISISGYHIREAGSTAVQEVAFTLANGIAYAQAAVDAGPLARRVRRPALVLLQRAQPLLPGGGEVPRGPAPVGADHARAVRRDEPEGARAPLPRADGRFDADRATAREQRRPRRGAGPRRHLRRGAVAAHELVRRGAGAAVRARGADRAPDAAGARSRGRHDRQRRPARRLLFHRGADGRDRGPRPGADRAGGRARRRGRRDRGGLRPGADRGRGLPLDERHRGGGARDRRRQPLRRGRGAARRAASPRSGGRAAPAGADCARARGAECRRRRCCSRRGAARRRGRGQPARAHARRRSARAARSARSAARCGSSGAPTTPSAPSSRAHDRQDLGRAGQEHAALTSGPRDARPARRAREPAILPRRRARSAAAHVADRLAERDQRPLRRGGGASRARLPRRQGGRGRRPCERRAARLPLGRRGDRGSGRRRAVDGAALRLGGRPVRLGAPTSPARR